VKEKSEKSIQLLGCQKSTKEKQRKVNFSKPKEKEKQSLAKGRREKKL